MKVGMRAGLVLLLVQGCGSGGSGKGVPGGKDAAPSDARVDTTEGDGGVETGDGPAGPMADAAMAPSTAPLVECRSDSQTISSDVNKVRERERVRGTNGEFEDLCDATGNLIQYVCDIKTTCGPGPNPACMYSYTGLVRPRLHDCGGQCRAGACEDRCPPMGQSVSFESANGAGFAVVRNDGDAQRYACTVGHDSPGDSFDCGKDIRAGTRARIDGTGSGGSCAAAFNMALTIEGAPAATQPHCTLGCRRGGSELRAGDGAPAAVVSCPAGGENAPGYAQGKPDTRGRLRGSNGEFEDTCTSSGNLVEYDCQVVFAAGAGPFRYTGAVVAQLHDCGGSCRAGACATRCPEAGQTVVYESTDRSGYAVVRNEAENRRYACAMTFDDARDRFDCMTGPRAGLRARIASADRRPPCTAEIPGFSLVVEGEPGSSECPTCPHCRLECRVVP